MADIQTITIDGVSHPVSEFSAQVQQAIIVYNSISADLTKAQLEVVKNQAALQHISSQISDAVKAELAKKAEANKAETPAETPAAE